MVTDQPVKLKVSKLILQLVEISCIHRIKARLRRNKCHDTFRNKLSTHLHYAFIKTQIANLERLTALSEEAVKLICSSYSPYSKV